MSDLLLENGDLILSPSGDIKIVSGKDKVKQYLEKAFSTRIGSDPLDPNYGSLLDDYIGKPLIDENLISIDQIISNTLTYFYNIYNSDPNIPNNEKIDFIKNTTYTLNDKGRLEIKIEIVLKNEEEINIQLEV